MKKLSIVCIILTATLSIHAQVGINTSTPNASSQLEIVSTNRGLLIPRMTAAQRTAIGTPAQGLLVYQNDAPAGIYIFQGGLWSIMGAVGPQGPAGLNGLDGANGPMGPQGIAGNDGLNGNNGLDGATGPMGPQGIAGNDGLNGNDGLDGATGPMGPQGPAGNDGAVGPQGPAGLLNSGSQFGNTAYWNGGFWVTNSNNLFNNGGSIGIGTSSPGAKLDVVGNVRIADGTQGNRKVLMSDGNGNASWNKIVSGYVLLGDVASGISTTVGGDVSFASKSNSGSSSTITVNFEDQGNTDFIPMITITSLGTADDDNDVETPVILNVTSTSFDIFLNETNGTTQDIRINIILMPF